MNELPATFQSLAATLRANTLQDFLSSERYKAATHQFDATLLLADRIVRACDQDIELGRAADITALLSALKRSENENVELPLDKLELWLKAVLRFAAPEQYERRKSGDEGKPTRRFNLFACLENLGLATPRELNLSGKDILQVDDPVTQSIWFAKYDRNDATHSTGLADLVVRSRITVGACTAMLAPLLLHFQTLQRALRNVITADPIFGIAAGVNRMVDSERSIHVNRFGGRIDFLKEVMELLQPAQDGGYLLITAEEGTGKSALCAKVSALVKPQGTALGASGAKASRAMSWLPGAVLHFGKSARDPETITAFLLAQVNTMVLARVGVPRITNAGDGDAVGEEDVVFEPATQPGHVSPSRRKVESGIESPLRLRHRPAMRDEQLRKAIFAGLDALARERGEAVLIIDALDEIGEDASSLGFLPPRLPAGVSALITSRANTRAVRWVLENLHIGRQVHLKHLNREDIPAISGVPDDTPNQRAFNENLYAASDGLPLIAHRLMEGVDVAAPSLSRDRLVGGAAAVFARQAQAWKSQGEVVKESLIALALFEPVGALNLELLQSYLSKMLAEVPDLPSLRDYLEPVANQVQGFEESQLKLSSRPFAEYVHGRYFSKSDLVKPLNALRSVLVDDSSIPASQLADFLDFWGHASRHEMHRSVAAGLIDDLAKAQDARRLLEIADHFQVWSKKTSVYALPCLKHAAGMEYPPSLRILGLMTIDGKCGAPNPVEGRRLLELACQKGDDRSLLTLGERLLDGRGLPASPQEGLSLLEQAVKKNVEQAPFALGVRLIFGNGVKRDGARGIELLQRVAATGNGRAMFVVAHTMLHGRLVEKNVVVGREWLIRAAESGHEVAMVELGERLLDGNEFERDLDAGRAWLEKAVQVGSTFAMTTLSSRMFEGLNLPKDVESARALLTQAADEGDEQSMRVLGMRLIDGDVCVQDTQAGFAWLEKAAQAGDDAAADWVNKELVRRLAIPLERGAAEQKIKDTLQNRSPEALSQLAYVLYSAGENDWAARVFEKSIERGHAKAGNNLFYILRRGEVSLPGTGGNPHELVDGLVEQKHAFAVVNKALALASGFACVMDWRAADSLMTAILLDDDDNDLVEWWHALAGKDDPEGHLVLGWLSHHRLVEDPDGWSPPRRFGEAVNSGWAIPDWLVNASRD